MTHSQRILRFNFWMTNLFLVIIGMFFLTTRLHAPVGVTLGLVIFNSVMLYFQLWVITHRFGVKKYKDCILWMMNANKPLRYAFIMLV